MEKENQMVARYKQALSYAACDFVRTKTNCDKCRCKGSCDCTPGTLGCRFTIEDKWKQDAGIKDNPYAKDHQRATASADTPEQLADIERRETVDHPDYYKTGGIEAIDVIEAWNLDFCLGNTIKYISRAGRKSDKVLEDLEKAAWYLNREIEHRKKNESVMADKWYIDTIKNSRLRKLLDYDAQEIISWIDYLPVQYDEEFVDALDDIIHEQEEFFGTDFLKFSKNQALTVVAKIIELKLDVKMKGDHEDDRVD